jgi:hypothetical protein
MTEQTQKPEAKDPELTLTLKISQINVLLASLDEVPHKYSRSIIDTIQQQASTQVQKLQDNGEISKVQM